MKKSVSALDDSVLCSNSWDWLLGLLGTGHGPCWPVEQLTAGDQHDGLTEVEITLRQWEAARRWRLSRPCRPEEGIFNLSWQFELVTITKDVKIRKNRTAILIQMVLRTCKLNSTQLKWITDQTMASSKSLSNRKSEAISHKTDVFPIDAAGLFVKETNAPSILIST